MTVDELTSFDALKRRKLVAILSYALFEPSFEKSARILDTLINSSDTTIAVSKTKDGISGIVAYTTCRKGVSEILYISVTPDERLKGVGKELIDHIRKKKECSSLIAETDNSSVNFYRHLGFKTQSLGEKYPGVERFTCCLNIGN